MKKIILWWSTKAHKPTTVFIGLLFLIGSLVLVPYFFSWSGVGLFALFYWISGGLGVTLCYHRLLTHKSFQTYTWIENILILFASLAWQGSPLKWPAMHRQHHDKSDEEGDTHSPVHPFVSFWRAQLIWILQKDADEFDCFKNTKDLQKKPMVMLFHKMWLFPQFILLTGLFLVGHHFGGVQLGLSWVVWQIFRIVSVLMTTNLVNSVCHLWGSRLFNTKDKSRNSWWVSLLTFGEGNHNTHHAHPTSAAHGLYWYGFDTTYLTIRVLKFFRLAWNVRHPKRDEWLEEEKLKKS
jgi:stearoyl-CoA desaturase (delta-9 desaturase)